MTQPVPAPPSDPWTAPTTGFWQALEPISHWSERLLPPYRHAYPVVLDGGQVLALPIRRLPGAPGQAVASLVANQASLAVVDHLAAAMAARVAVAQPEVLIGLPTLGMAFAPGVARALGHTRWVPLGYSRKFWYDEALSTSVTSITSPGAGKRIYLDPNQLALLTGRRVAIVDDVVSSAQTLEAVWTLLEAQGVAVVASVVAMRQGQAWRTGLAAGRLTRLFSVFDSPRLLLHSDGWYPQPAPAPGA